VVMQSERIGALSSLLVPGVGVLAMQKQRGGARRAERTGKNGSSHRQRLTHISLIVTGRSTLTFGRRHERPVCGCTMPVCWPNPRRRARSSPPADQASDNSPISAPIDATLVENRPPRHGSADLGKLAITREHNIQSWRRKPPRPNTRWRRTVFQDTHRGDRSVKKCLRYSVFGAFDGRLFPVILRRLAV
jgi:hypothetical protein